MAKAHNGLKNEHLVRPVLHPELQPCQRYAKQRFVAERASAPGTVFSPYFLVRTLERASGLRRKLDLLCAPQVIQRWREAILTNVNDLPDSVRRLLSGHRHDGGPLDGPHLAFIPLAFVDHPHADGHLHGMGLVLPEAISPDDHQCALSAISRVDRLLLGRLGVWRIGCIEATPPLRDLHPRLWTAYPQGARQWSTVTPIAFDWHPKTRDSVRYRSEVARMITQACLRIGLPEPREVIVTSVSALLGAPPVHAYPRLERKDGSLRCQTHAILIFEEPVCGPILLGAGRFLGYGVCRPLDLPRLSMEV